jgi:Zn finger protein HypA/HybF involved in hydrogenase expression
MFHLETDGKKFECVECGRVISVAFVQSEPRPITCEECGTEYSVTEGFGSGLSVTLAKKNLSSEYEDFDEEFDEE